MLRGLAFNVQRYSIHDGPGIRTTVFLKGCPLRCLWCHNPEAISGRIEFGFFPDRCIGCHECIQACPHGVHVVDAQGQRVVYRERCRSEARCVEVCYAEALERIGYELTVDEAVAQVERDRPFYEASGGGVTISGGEPLRQAAFTAAFLARCRARGLHAAIETCGYAPWPALATAAAHADLVLFDLKQMDSASHQALTGVPNALILDNLARLYASPGRGALWIRYPFISTMNDQPENYHAMGRFLRALTGPQPPVRLRVDLLPYHQLGQSKYRKLGRPYALEHLQPPARATIEAAADALAGYGLDPHIGG
ncbi:MAG: glycyl-radical enzyme activating protein [Chloroflexi bacterium]|nr:glycyl-radical enzyme activating protein [Chloroflexota bacterium]